MFFTHVSFSTKAQKPRAELEQYEQIHCSQFIQPVQFSVRNKNGSSNTVVTSYETAHLDEHKRILQ